MILADSEVDTLSNTPFYSQLSQALTSKNMSVLNSTARKYFNLGKDVSFVSQRERTYSVIGGNFSHASAGGNQPYNDAILFPTVDGAEILIGMYGYVTPFIVSIDANGYNRRPNVQGLDYFTFFIKEDGSVELGWPESAETFCLSAGYHTAPHTAAGCYSSVVRNNWEITYY